MPILTLTEATGPAGMVVVVERPLRPRKPALSLTQEKSTQTIAPFHFHVGSVSVSPPATGDSTPRGRR